MDLQCAVGGYLSFVASHTYLAHISQTMINFLRYHPKFYCITTDDWELLRIRALVSNINKLKWCKGLLFRKL